MLRFTTAGESHGRSLIAIVEGLPAGLPVDQEAIDYELRRRQLGYGRGGRMKIERDHADILTGVRHGLTLGSPITLFIENKDWPNWTEVMAAEPRELAPEKSRRLKRHVPVTQISPAV
jgi:chorismate synthase